MIIDAISQLRPALYVARDLACYAHRAQLDKAGNPYILHVERVAEAVSEPAKPVAWLHDVLEDCHEFNENLLRAIGFSEEIVSAVVLLTRKPPYSYASYIEEIARSGSKLAVEVKIADLRDHLDENCVETLRKRYEEALERLLLVYDPTSSESWFDFIERLAKSGNQAAIDAMAERCQKRYEETKHSCLIPWPDNWAVKRLTGQDPWERSKD